MIGKKDARFTHLRYFSDEDNSVSCKGGITLCYATIGDTTYIAHAYCNPCDNFSYEKGRERARGRLVSALVGGTAAKGFVEQAGTYNKEEAAEFVNDQVAMLSEMYGAYRIRDIKGK